MCYFYSISFVRYWRMNAIARKKSYVHFNQKNTKKKLSVSLWITSASQRKKEDTLNWNCVIASYRIKQNKQMLILHGDAPRYL